MCAAIWPILRPLAHHGAPRHPVDRRLQHLRLCRVVYDHGHQRHAFIVDRSRSSIAATGYIVYRDRLTLPQAVGILVACVRRACRPDARRSSLLAGVPLQRRRPVGPGLAGHLGALHGLSARTAGGASDVVPDRARSASAWCPCPGRGAGAGARRQITVTPGAVGATLYVAMFAAVIAYLCLQPRGRAHRRQPRGAVLPPHPGLRLADGGRRFWASGSTLYHLAGWAIIIAGIVAAQFGRRPSPARRRPAAAAPTVPPRG